MSSPVTISSTSQFDGIVKNNVYTVVDMFAEWCGPCKAIAPTFNQLAASETKAGRMAFVKVDVDAHQSLAQRYSVSAMPTFLILKNGTVTNTVRGANPSGLRSAVLSASADAAKAPAKSSAAFQAGGRTLGSGGANSRGTSSGGPNLAADLARSIGNSGSFVDNFIRFIMLYFTTLFSFVADTAGQQSPFSLAKRD